MRGFARRFDALLVAAAIFALAFAVQARHEVLTNDEGIMLEPAKRILRGERPYVDFFAYMSPGSYWIHAAALKMFGENLVAGRLPVLIGFAAQCGMLFWLVRRWVARGAVAGIAVAMYAVFQMASPDLLTPQHRWDSGTLALGALVVLVRGGPAWLAGALVAMAALCTPSMGLLAAVAFGWCWWQDRRRAMGFAAGGVALAIPVTLYLAISGQLGPFVEQMRWLGRNYAEVNRVPYGHLIGGWGSVFEGSSGVDLPVRALIAFGLALPALLPVLALALWAAMRRAIDGPLALLLMANVVFAAVSFPRPDVMHLAFTMALPMALVTIAMARFLPARVSAGLATAAAVSALLFLFPLVGRIAKGADPALARVRTAVPRGSELYVHPYMPVLYFLTGARNPTAYDYLAPGMMTAEDESRVLADLERRPPERVMYLKLKRGEFLRVFPNATRLSERFRRIEEWIERNYRPGDVAVGGYRLWHRMGDHDSSARHVPANARGPL